MRIWGNSGRSAECCFQLAVSNTFLLKRQAGRCWCLKRGIFEMQTTFEIHISRYICLFTLHRSISAWVTASRAQVSYRTARNGLHFALQNHKPLFRYTAASASICQLSLAAWHLGGVQWILMTYSLPKWEACRDGVGVAYCDINSIDGHFFFYPVRVCTESKRRSRAVKHLLTSLWSRVARKSCPRGIRSRQGEVCQKKEGFLMV